MSEKDREILLHLKNRFASLEKFKIRKMLLYGSRAIDNFSEDSDLDVIVLVDGKTQEIEEILDEITYQVMWDNDFNPIISLKVFETSKFNDAVENGYSFYKNVEKAGIAI